MKYLETLRKDLQEELDELLAKTGRLSDSFSDVMKYTSKEHTGLLAEQALIMTKYAQTLQKRINLVSDEIRQAEQRSKERSYIAFLLRM